MSDDFPLPPAANETASAAENPASPPPARKRRLGLMLALPAVLLLGGAYVWLSGGRYVSTDNAYLHQARIAVAPVLSGRVARIGFVENQTVHAGDLLFQIDPEPYRLAVAQAQVALDQARLQVGELKATYRAALVQQKQADDNAAYLKSELDRQQALTEKGVSSTTALDEARQQSLQANEQKSVAEQAVIGALAALGGQADIAADDHPAVRAAMVDLDRAKWNLEQTTVTAPADGVIYQAGSFKPGQMVTAGTSVFSLVETADVWVEANFKETQLDGIAPGQSAALTFDAAPGHTFAGRVEAIGAGTGAEFSLLPAQNATGNWVKVTQRVPVRIRLDAANLPVLSSGLSAQVTVDLHRPSGLAALFGMQAAAQD